MELENKTELAIILGIQEWVTKAKIMGWVEFGDAGRLFDDETELAASIQGYIKKYQLLDEKEIQEEIEKLRTLQTQQDQSEPSS